MPAACSTWLKKTNLAWKLPATIGMATPHISLEDRIKQIISQERQLQTRLKKPVLLVLTLAAVFLAVILTGYRWSFAQQPNSQSVTDQSRLAVNSEVPRIPNKKNAALSASLGNMLHQAVENPGQYRRAEVLIQKGADLVALYKIRIGANVNARDSKGITPLFYARKFKQTDVEKALLEKGAVE